MKKRLGCILLVMCMLFGSAQAAGLSSGEYADVPSVMTQDSVTDVEVDQDCEITLLQPDEESMALLDQVYRFVRHEKNRPVRFYDEETQQKIQALLPEVDKDILHMSEFMAQDMQGTPGETVRVQKLLDVDYQPGQLVVAVLGIEDENGEYLWFPYLADVPYTGLITYNVPREDYDILSGEKVIFHVLTDRVGPRGGVIQNYEIETDGISAPSKDAGDIVNIYHWYSEEKEAIDHSFRIFLVDKTPAMQQEIKRIGEHLSDGLAAIDYFPEEIRQEAQYLLPEGVQADTLMIYDAVAVMAENYRDTYGDVACESTFASAYSDECSLVAIIGFEVKDAKEEPYFTWYCLRAESVEALVEIVFKQLVIPQMEVEPAMLLVLSQPMSEE